MPKNSGKLDKLCADILRKTKARAAVLVIINNKDGARLSALEEFRLLGEKQDIVKLPQILRRVAKEIERGSHER